MSAKAPFYETLSGGRIQLSGGPVFSLNNPVVLKQSLAKITTPKEVTPANMQTAPTTQQVQVQESRQVESFTAVAPGDVAKTNNNIVLLIALALLGVLVLR